MKQIFKNASVNKKLFAFAGLTSLLVLAALGTGALYFLQIERANLLKEDVAKTVQTMLVTRGAEKTYLQFFKAEQKNEFEKQAKKVKAFFEKLKSSSTDEALIRTGFVYGGPSVRPIRSCLGKSTSSIFGKSV